MSPTLALFDDEYTGPRWTYGLTYRPLGTGQVPPGWIVWSNRAHPEYPHGTVDYPRELASDDAAGYEMVLVGNSSGGS